MRGLIQSALALEAQSIDAVLAVVVEVAGSAARKQGAMSLFSETGHVTGALGGGTLEQHLHAAVLKTLTDKTAMSIQLNAAQDSSHTAMEADDVGGNLHILLLPLPLGTSPLRKALVMACVGSAWLRLRLELGDDNERGVSLGAGEARIGQEMFAFDSHGEASDCARHFFHHVSLSFAPPPRIALLGSGSESLALVRLAHLLGWYAEIIDARPASLTGAASRHVDLIHRYIPDKLPDLLAGQTGKRLAAAQGNFGVLR